MIFYTLLVLYLRRWLLITWGVCGWLPIYGQFFLEREAPCPTGPTVSLDTLTYVPDKPLPFDRCFFLKLIQPGTSRVDYFGLTPIDKRGENNTNLRDRSVYIRSEYLPGESRNEARKSKANKIDALRRSVFLRRYDVFNRTVKGDKTELLLRIPPLSPGREYRLTLLSNDDKAFNEVLDIGAQILKAQQNKNSQKDSILKEAEQKHLQSIIGTKERTNLNSGFFNRSSFKAYPRQISGLKILLSKDDGSGFPPCLFRLFFVEKGKSFSLADTLKGPVAVGVTSVTSISSQQFIIRNMLEAKRGCLIEFFDPKPYDLYVLSTCEKLEPQLDLTGTLQFDTLNLTYQLTPVKPMPKGYWIRLANTPLEKFKTIRDADASIGTSFSSITSCSSTLSLTALMNKAIQCPCEKEGIKDLTVKDDLLRSISVLHEHDPVVLSQLLLGQLSLKDPAAKLVKLTNYPGRLANLNTTLIQLNALVEFHRKVTVILSTQASQSQCLADLLAQVKSNQQAMSSIVETRAILQNDLRDQMGLLTIIPVTDGSTSVMDLMTETKFRIIPDFGFLLVFKGNNTATVQDIAPYLGFQIGFRPIDKNIPFRLVRYKSIWHRLSFSAGLTLKSLRIENQREDLFDNKTLLTGLGVRINNYLRATVGTVWFKAIDPNSLSTDRPLRFSPTAGISVDVELQELFGGISKLFK